MQNSWLKYFTRCLIIELLGCALATPALAQRDAASTFPSKTIRIVIPFPPGGLPDVISRMVAPKMAESFGQPVVVDNKAGASGAIALEFVARSPADGHAMAMIT